MEPLQPFTFIKTASCLDEEHELFNPDIEETIQKLGLPYNFAMALRISQSKLSEERKQFYIEEMKEKSKTVVQEQEELQRRFLEMCNDLEKKEEYEKNVKEAQEKSNVILPEGYREDGHNGMAGTDISNNKN